MGRWMERFNQRQSQKKSAEAEKAAVFEMAGDCEVSTISDALIWMGKEIKSQIARNDAEQDRFEHGESGAAR